jgi:hypothetical protein
MLFGTQEPGPPEPMPVPLPATNRPAPASEEPPTAPGQDPAAPDAKAEAPKAESAPTEPAAPPDSAAGASSPEAAAPPATEPGATPATEAKPRPTEVQVVFRGPRGMVVRYDGKNIKLDAPFTVQPGPFVYAYQCPRSRWANGRTQLEIPNDSEPVVFTPCKAKR